MAEIFPVYVAIRERLRSAVESAGAGFIEGYVPEGESAPKDADGTLKPFVVLEMGDGTEHYRGKGICGPINDLEILDFLVICTAEAYQYVVGLQDIVTKSLIGFKPTDDAGPIRRVGGTINSPVGALLHPMRYNKGISFWVTIGAITSE